MKNFLLKFLPMALLIEIWTSWATWAEAPTDGLRVVYEGRFGLTRSSVCFLGL